jgi:hypothetical protein
MALTQDQLIKMRGTPREREFTATAAVIYGGDILMSDTGGLVSECVDTSGAYVCGVAKHGCGVSGSVTVLDGCDFLCTHASAAITDINSVFMATGGGVTDTHGTYHNAAGVVTGYYSTTHLWVYIDFALNVGLSLWFNHS